jgi:RHS repeat-associated protein
MLKDRQISHICRKKHKSITKYAHNAQAQRVFKTAPLYAVTNPEPTATPELLALFTTFFESLWSPATNPDGTTVQKAGMSYVYDEDGTLIADTLTGGATTTWGQSARYIYLPTASGPMPVAAIYGTKHYAVQSDHLNTPRRLIQSDGQVAWQWAYSAFGDEQPMIAKNRFANVALNQAFGTSTVPAVTFNLRYPGQYFDQESGLHYNYHRSYSAMTGRYTQSDPIGLDGGWNRFGYVGQNPLGFTDPLGLRGLTSGGSATGISTGLGITGLGIINAVRPTGMSRLEERQFDRYCTTDQDPCAALKAAAKQAIQAARSKMINMLNDPKQLFIHAINSPNPSVTGTNTTWANHRSDLDGAIANVNAIISLGQKMGCDMTPEIIESSTLYVPMRPN